MAEHEHLPLFAWGKAWGAARARKLELRRRAALMGLASSFLGATLVLPPRPVLLWNASASAPLGLYLVTAPDRIARGDLVVARLSEPARTLAARRHYLPRNVPLVKRVAALGGDMVCADGQMVWVAGLTVARRRETDSAGRPMPRWDGCMRLPRGSVFLLMPGIPDSFDGRYFGPVPRSDIIGKASLLWAR